MQTFLPYPDFRRSARVLDRKRLGKQRLECQQIASALRGSKVPWRNHPAVLMWQGYGPALLVYWECIIIEWEWRGYENNIVVPSVDLTKIKRPWWLGDERLHSSHRAALMFKDPTAYALYQWSEVPKVDYWWPTKEAGNAKSA